ncbi:hypothetical protein ASF74_14820 [Arthrobacter sp. Leaf145]|nr:hypothetical protein ASF74_14820 [Arthrobacter sp. Leaf145]
MSPQRIQRKRTKGWRMPENTAYVGRPSKWGNPTGWTELLEDGYSVAHAHQVAMEAFEDGIAMGDIELPDVTELAGKNLACWCPLDYHCHADVLLELANQ